MATPILRYGIETWTINTKNIPRIQATEMTFLEMTG